MIPTAILAGAVLAVWFRWWAVAITAVGWAVVVAVAEPSTLGSAIVLGAANGLVGVAVTMAVRQALPSRPT